MPQAVIVHGGAWSIPADLLEPHAAGCRAAVARAWNVLQAGGTALDAVEAAIVEMEDNPVFDAGVGSFLNQDGHVELDAGLMDGHTFSAGSVAAVRQVRNPITLARRVLESEHVLIVGSGATRFAAQAGCPLCSDEDLVVDRERELWKRMQAESPNWTDFMFGQKPMSTVGAVVCDRAGRVAAGTSTGGSPNKVPGRVGDVPLVGCGFYADKAGGGSCTGWGEAIMRVGLARYGVERLAAGQPASAAAADAIQSLADKTGGVGGIILADGRGQVGFAYNTEHMAYAYQQVGMDEPVVHV